MIEIIDFSTAANPGSLYVIWDLGGSPQDDFAPSQFNLLEALFKLEYIADYTRIDGSTVDVAVMINGRKYWVELERWLADEVDEKVCTEVINHLLIYNHNV